MPHDRRIKPIKLSVYGNFDHSQLKDDKATDVGLLRSAYVQCQPSISLR